MPDSLTTLRGRSASRWVEVTAVVGCGNGCVYCPQDKLSAAYGRGGSRALGAETFGLLLDHLDPATATIHFSGFSEIFLHPQGHEFIAQAYERTFDVMLCTTLVGLTADKISYLVDRAVRFEWVRLHEFDSPTFDRTSFERLGNLLRGAGLTANFSSARVRRPVSRGGSMWDSGFHAGPVVCDRVECNVVLPDGRVCLCCCDWGLRHVIGNLSTQDYDGVEMVEARRLVREAAATPGASVVCKTCEVGVRL